MAADQIVTFTLFRYSGYIPKFKALKNMGLIPRQLKHVNGMKFFKLMGSGKGNGFSIKPNFSIYSLLAVWSDSKAADFFFESELFQKLSSGTNEVWTKKLQAFQAHGSWGQISPFHIFPAVDKNKDRIAVLTRASIKTKYLYKFWKDVPSVSASVGEMKGREFSIGIGELPLIMQATFSIWENATLMEDFAYKSHYHKNVVKKTRALGWYGEEMFARFRIIEEIDH